MKKGGCGVGKSIGKPNCSFCSIVWTARGTGIIIIINLYFVDVEIVTVPIN